MKIQVTGKNVDVGDAFHAYVVDKITQNVGKYLGPQIDGHVRLEKVRGQFHTSCQIRLRSGLLIEAGGDGVDAYASADAAVEHLEKRVRRHRRRLKDHHQANGKAALPAEMLAGDFVVQVADAAGDDDVDDDGVDPTAEDNPIVIAETQRPIRDLAVSEAVMQLDLTQAPFLVFRNAGSGTINVVYKREDGNVGWIDPIAVESASASKRHS